MSCWANRRWIVHLSGWPMLWLFCLPALADTPHQDILAKETVAAFSILDSSQWQTNWHETNLSKLMRDELMQPTWNALLWQDGNFAIPWTVGISFDELASMSAGVFTVAVTAEQKGAPAIVLLVDVESPQTAARILLAATTRLQKAGARLVQQTVGDSTVKVYTLPPEDPAGRTKQYCYALKNRLLLAATTPQAIVSTFERIDDQQRANLARTNAFQETSIRALGESQSALFWWFVDPLEFWSAHRKLFPSEKSIEGTDFLQLARKEGFQTIDGIGGAGLISGPQHGVLITSYVDAKKPLTRAMRMAQFHNASDLKPAHWVPTDVSSHTAVSVQFSQTIEGFANLFDGLYGEGEDGVFKDVLKDIRDDSAGPQVDLTREVIERLDPRLDRVTFAAEGGQLDWLIGVGVKDASHFSEAIDRLFAGDDQAKRIKFGDHHLWELSPLENDIAQEPLLSHSVICVRDEVFLIANRSAVVRKVFEESNGCVSDSVDFQGAMAQISAHSGDAAAMKSFAYLKPHCQTIYQRIKSDQNFSGEGTVLNVIGFSANLAAVNREKLPAFKDIAKYCGGTMSNVVIETETGWKSVIIVNK